jgi:hypothetical protein
LKGSRIRTHAVTFGPDPGGSSNPQIRFLQSHGYWVTRNQFNVPRVQEVGPARPNPHCLIAYFRVSTDRQGRSGLGLEAQRAAVLNHLTAVGGQLRGEFTEIESGKRNDRPQLAPAIASAKKATLIIAKLDRLARNVHFISGLMESGVDFVAADNPHANRLMVHLLAAFAEHEREQISKRTKDPRGDLALGHDLQEMRGLGLSGLTRVRMGFAALNRAELGSSLVPRH